MWFFAWGPIAWGIGRYVRPGRPRPWPAPKPKAKLEPTGKATSPTKEQLPEAEPANRLPFDIDTVSVTRRRVSSNYSQEECFVARSEEAGGLDIAVGPPRPRSRWFSGDPFETGDSQFDTLFSVETNDPILARAWLGPHVREAMIRANGCSFRLINRIAEVRSSPWGNLEEARRAAAVLSKGSALIAAEWNRLASGLSAELEEPAERHDRLPVIQVDLGGFSYSIQTTQSSAPSGRTRPAIFTRIDVQHRKPGGPTLAIVADAHKEDILAITNMGGPSHTFVKGFSSFGEHGAVQAGAILDATTHAEFAGAVSDDRTMSVFLRGVVLEPTLVQAAMKNVRQLSERIEHPYR